MRIATPIWLLVLILAGMSACTKEVEPSFKSLRPWKLTSAQYSDGLSDSFSYTGERLAEWRKQTFQYALRSIYDYQGDRLLREEFADTGGGEALTESTEWTLINGYPSSAIERRRGSVTGNFWFREDRTFEWYGEYPARFSQVDSASGDYYDEHYAYNATGQLIRWMSREAGTGADTIPFQLLEVYYEKGQAAAYCYFRNFNNAVEADWRPISDTIDLEFEGELLVRSRNRGSGTISRSYTYDSDGNPSRESRPQGGQTLTIDYTWEPGVGDLGRFLYLFERGLGTSGIPGFGKTSDVPEMDNGMKVLRQQIGLPPI